MKRFYQTLIIIFFLISFSLPGKAQMFSVESRPTQVRTASSFFRIGYAPASFDFTGDPASVNPGNRFDFSSGAFLIAMESPGFNLRALFGNNLSGMDDRNLFSLSFSLSNTIRLNRNPSFGLGLPLEINTSLTNVGYDGTELRFRQSDLGIGGGLAIRNRISRKFNLSNQFTAGYGFSNSSGNIFGGTVYYLNGKSRLNFGDVIAGRSVSLGYDFSLRSFNIDDEVYDYDLIIHEITLGISF